MMGLFMTISATSNLASDLDLLAEFSKTGNTHAFETMMQRYSEMVYNTCHRILFDRLLAEDATQETFYRLMRKPDQVSRNLPAWLHRTATHICFDLLRSSTARKAREIAYQLELQRKRDGMPEHWQDVMPQLDEALAEMPEEMRDLLIDHFLMGQSQRKLASQHDLSPTTISRRLKDALTSLQKRLSSRGIVLSVAPLFVLLTQYETHAVPMTLTAKLGKIALFSATTSSAAVTATTVTGSLVGMKIVMIGVGSIVVGLAAVGLFYDKTQTLQSKPVQQQTFDPNAAKHQLVVNQKSKVMVGSATGKDATSELQTKTHVGHSLPNIYQGEFANADAVCIRIRKTEPTLKSNVVSSIIAPRPHETQVTATFGDGHLQSLSIEALERLILEQESKPLAEFITRERIYSSR